MSHPGVVQPGLLSAFHPGLQPATQSASQPAIFDARRLATAVPEDIVFCIDTDIEAARELKSSSSAAAATGGDGAGGEGAGGVSSAQYAPETGGAAGGATGAAAASSSAAAAAAAAASLTRLDAIRQALLLYTHSKLAMNPSHRFALATLKGNTATAAVALPATEGAASPGSSPRQPQFSWVVEHFTNDMNTLISGFQSLHATSCFSSVDLSPLFRTLASESQRSADRGRSLRLILFFCRSSCIPGPPPLHVPRPSIPFTADCIYWHDRPNNFNCPQAVFDGLTAALEAVSMPEPFIWEYSSNVARYIFRATSSLLAHPAQRSAEDYLSMPKVLDSQSAGAPGAGTSGPGVPGQSTLLPGVHYGPGNGGGGKAGETYIGSGLIGHGSGIGGEKEKASGGSIWSRALGHGKKDTQRDV
ncbi:hypothetical protein CLOM_g15580 [Closterium sp. NIES-68]|nr:hypothetical protein CLOM_g15580 [Closterium sp. NIES-68]GJP79550.1 hypothetical protein CLOP_g9773 [Closterium sp. NIES-67]